MFVIVPPRIWSLTTFLSTVFGLKQYIQSTVFVRGSYVKLHGIVLYLYWLALWKMLPFLGYVNRTGHWLGLTKVNVAASIRFVQCTRRPSVHIPNIYRCLYTYTLLQLLSLNAPVIAIFHWPKINFMPSLCTYWSSLCSLMRYTGHRLVSAVWVIPDNGNRCSL